MDSLQSPSHGSARPNQPDPVTRYENSERQFVNRHHDIGKAELQRLQAVSHKCNKGLCTISEFVNLIPMTIE